MPHLESVWIVLGQRAGEKKAPEDLLEGMGLRASCHEAAVVAASAGVEGLGRLCDLVLHLAESLILGAYDPGDEVVHINISIDIAQQSGLDEPEGVEESTERVSTWVLEDLDEYHLNCGVNAEDHLPAGVPIH